MATLFSFWFPLQAFTCILGVENFEFRRQCRQIGETIPATCRPVANPVQRRRVLSTAGSVSSDWLLPGLGVEALRDA
jgi:hypothetical protein